MTEDNHDLTIEEIYIPSKHDKDSYLCEDFIVYPEGKEKSGGYLMGLIELRATPLAEGEKIVQTVINSLKESYYNQINSSPDPQKLNLETVFEYALQKTNEALVEMIQIGHIHLVLENLHYLIAVAKPNAHTKDIDFFFTQQGLVHAYLLHRTKQNNYKVINIVENTPKLQDGDADKLKIFSSTLSGKIYHRNALYLCSEIFSNYIPAHKVNKILSANDLGTAVDYFKNLINNVKNNSYLTYSAIFIKMEEKRLPSEKPISQRSIDSLLSTTERTEKYLTPTFALNIRGYLGNFFALFKKKSQPAHQLRGPKASGRTFLGVLKYIINIFKFILIFSGKIFRTAFELLSGKRKFSFSFFRKTLSLPKTILVSSRDKIKGLAGANKTILLAIVLAAAIIVSGVFWIRHNREARVAETAYAAQIKNVKNLINDAQVNLIYNDESRSLVLVKQAEEIIKYLPQATNDQKANYEDLLKQNDTIKNKLLHIEKIVARLIAEPQNNGQAARLNQLQKINDTLLVSTQDNSLFTINLKDNSAAAPATSAFGDLYHLLAEDSNVYFITNQNKLIQYSFNDKIFKALPIVWGDGLQINDAIIYNKAIYVADAKNKEIFKFRPAVNEGFGGREKWIKDKGEADLSAAAALTIDGNIYLSSSNGRIYKFFTGKVQPFEVKPIEPALTNVKKIFTNSSLDHIYILEENGKRIAKIDKNGNFAGQYLFDSLPDVIKDFIIDNGAVYLLAGNKVFQATLK